MIVDDEQEPPVRMSDFLMSAAYRSMTHSAHLMLARVTLEIAAGGHTISDDELVEYGVQRHSIEPTIAELVALGVLTAMRRSDATATTFGMARDWRSIASVEDAKRIAKAARRRR